MKKSLLFLAVLFTCQLHAADYYWVGGAGNWSELSHWRLGSSSGSIPSIIPSSADNVFFDANSGFGTTTATNTVTVDANSFCNNMTWGAVPNNPRLVTANAAFTIQVAGSLVLSPVTTYNVLFRFQGSAPATLTTNGTVLGDFGLEVDKPGSSLTLTDNLNVPSNTNSLSSNAVYLTAGTFDVNSKTVNIYQFVSMNTNVRTFEMTNTNMAVRFAFRFQDINKTLHATGSTLTSYTFISDGGTYNRVTATNGAGPNTIIIANSIFKSLTFSPAAGAIYSDIGNNNTVDTLVFNREGSIGSNNTIGSVLFTLSGSLDGTNNVMRKITALNTFQVGNNYVNTVDSVILAPNRTTIFRGTFNINKYLYLAGAACDAYTEVYGDPTAGTVNFASGAFVDISNVILTNVIATGPVTPIAVNGIDGTGNTGFTITEPTGTGTTLYWVGGSGDWNNKNHWSLSSGGAGGACVPFKNDNVIFDAASGLAGGIVTTSSSSFCKDITWVAGVGASTFNEEGGSFRIYGSAVMQPNVSYTAGFEFYGSDAVDLTTNGAGAGASNFAIVVYKTGSGSLTLQDNWINTGTNSSITFHSGGLNMAGRTVSFWIFNSNTSETRTLDISNATITANLRWIYLGANKSMTGTGSYITSHARFLSNAPAVNYPRVDLTEIRRETNQDFDISNTIFGQLTFTSTSTTSLGRINNGNTIRRLEYKGSGIIGSSVNNNIDSLILAGSRNYIFVGTNTILKYIKAEATPCSGLNELRASSTGIATLALQSTTEVHIDNVYLQNMRVTGPGVPYIVNGADAGGNTGWDINSAAGSDRYWVGGSGDWNDPNHWSATSGGAAGACVPTVYDNVYFDAGSGFTAVNKTVTTNNGNAYCRNFNWENATNAPIWNKSATWNMEIWGDSIVLNPAVTLNGLVYAKGTNPAFLKGNVLGNFDFNIDKPGGSLTVLNDYNNPQTNIGLYNGALNASGLKLSVLQVDNSAATANVFAIDISNSTVIAPFGWRFQGSIANHTLNAANSSLTTGDFKAEGMQYDTVMITGSITTDVAMNSTTINRLTFTDPGTASTVGIGGSNNILGRVEFKGSGTITGTNNIMDTLIFFPGNTYTLTAGTNNIVNDAWYGSGTPCRATEIVSSSLASNATITKNGDPVVFDYIRMRRITAAGSAAPFEAQKHSTNLGNNTNWNIAPYDGAAPILGLGPDSAVAPANFPITLYTNGFFGSPSSQYIWNDNSTADTLLVAGPGTYSIDVSFPDGCSISDEIVVTEASILPVTLTSFTAKLVECQSRLDWKITDAVNFSRFEVEKSINGNSYTKVATVPLTSAASYSYTDDAGNSPINYFRLKMIDINGDFEYSNIVSVKSNCLGQNMRVYPRITDNQVQVFLPQGFERATIQVYNINGQRMNPTITGTGSARTVYLKGLPKASYVLQVINGTERKSFTIVRH
jgi:trimeric autotransporter adhesin